MTTGVGGGRPPTCAGWRKRGSPMTPEGGLGYEIHHGRTRVGSDASAWVVDAEDGGVLGHAAAGHWGCYLHGVFGNDALRRDWLRRLGVAEHAPAAWKARIDEELDRLADAVEASLEVDRFFGWLGLGEMDSSPRGT